MLVASKFILKLFLSFLIISNVVFPIEYSNGFTPGISSKITVPFAESGFLGVMFYGIVNGIYVNIIYRLIKKSKSLLIKMFWLKMLISGFSFYALIIFMGILKIIKLRFNKL